MSPGFVRFGCGQATDVDALRSRWDAGHADLVAAADGWLGTSAGTTPGGHWVAAIAYRSGAAARNAEASPAYQAWWDGVRDFVDGPVVVEETADVHLWVPPGRSGRGPAGFVQVMRATVGDRARFEAIEEAVGDRFAALRPDVLGGLRAWHGPQRVTVVDWFTSEAEARAGEARPVPDDLRDQFSAWLAELDGVAWFDLSEPWESGPFAGG